MRNRIMDKTNLGHFESAVSTVSAAVSPAVGATLWSGILAVEGTPTGDGRVIERNALVWDDLPLPLRYAPKDIGGHDGAEVVGRILSISRRGDGAIVATGDFDPNSSVGQEATRQVREGLTTGVSVDLDSISFEVRLSPNAVSEMENSSPTEEGGKNADGSLTVVAINNDDELYVINRARLRAATIVAVPAFKDANIAISGINDGTVESGTAVDAVEAYGSMTASGRSDNLPSPGLFANPDLSGPTPLTVDRDSGRIYGHLALWGTCHTGIADACVTAPSSASQYAYFATGTVLTSANTYVPTGVITMDTGHAKPALGPRAAASHYDNTGAAIADVSVGEDDYGIWFSGSLRRGVSDDDIRRLEAASLSGDWRGINGNLELVAALAVNVPGFPVPRTHGFVASGVQRSLVAAGMVELPDYRPGSDYLSAEAVAVLNDLARDTIKLKADNAMAKGNQVIAEIITSKIGEV